MRNLKEEIKRSRKLMGFSEGLNLPRQTKARVLASKFLNWYLDPETIHDLVDDVAYNLKETGNFHLTVEELFDRVSYIPADICEQPIPQQLIPADVEEDDFFELNPEDCQLINDYQNP